MPAYRIRRMRPEDVPAVLEIWAANDLHEGLHTIQSFMSVDPDGFVVAVEVEEEEEEKGQLNAEDDCGDKGDQLEDAKTSEEEGRDLKKKKVVVLNEEKLAVKSASTGTGGVGLSKLSGILSRKQICCCSVQGPASPPPPAITDEMATCVSARSPTEGSESSMLICRRRESKFCLFY